MDRQIDCSLKLVPKKARQRRAHAFLLNFLPCAIFQKLNSAQLCHSASHATCHSANSFRLSPSPRWSMFSSHTASNFVAIYVLPGMHFIAAYLLYLLRHETISFGRRTHKGKLDASGLYASALRECSV